MANTYTQLYIRFVFSVKRRENLIKESFRDHLEKVICGIVNNHKCKTYAIYCNPDHTHIFIGMHPAVSPSKLMEQVKSGSFKALITIFFYKKRYLKAGAFTSLPANG